MKSFIYFAALVAVAIARPTSNIWTPNQVYEALENPKIDAIYRPVIEDAFNQIMEALHDGKYVEAVIMPFDIDSITLKPVPGSVASQQPAQSGSPLVQIIVNVEDQKQEVIHEQLPPVIVEDETPADIVPSPIEVIDSEDVQKPEINPIDIIAVSPIESWGPDGPEPIVAGDVGPM